jgi:hypothetical protein
LKERVQLPQQQRRSIMMNQMGKNLPRRLGVFAVVLCFAAALGAQTTEWKTYSYPADGFRASYPSEPQFSKRDVPTDKGSFELRAYLVQDGEAALFVGVCDYGSAIADRNSDTVLDGAQKGAIDNVSGHLISGKKITLGTYPGKEFEAENDTMHFYARIYLVGTTLYQTLIAAPLGKPYASATRFLDSFQLIARTGN